MKTARMLMTGILGGGVRYTYDYYVAKTGNDTTGDGSLANPWLTIGKALTAITAAGGKSIGLGAGTYAEDLSGAAGGYMTFPSYTNTVTIGGLTSNAESVKISGIEGTGTINVFLQNNKLKLQHLSVQGYNGKAAAVHVAGINLQFQNVRFSNVNNNCVRIVPTWTINTISFTDCVMTTTGVFNLVHLVPVAGVKISGVTFTRCTMTGSPKYAVYLGNGTNADLENITFDGCQIGSADATTYQSMYINGVTNLALTDCSVIQAGNFDNILTLKTNGLTITRGLYKSGLSHALAIGNDAPATANTVQGVVIDGATIDGRPGAHALLIGYGGDGAIIRNCTVYGGDHGLVVKHCANAQVLNNNITGGTATALYFKAAVGSIATGNTIQSAAGHCVQCGVGDAGAKSGNVTLTGNTIVGTGTSDIYYWSGDTGDSGGCVVDNNEYTPGGSAKFGSVRADTDVQTLAELQAAWAGYGDGSNDSHSTANGQ
jgi:uncharacterized protein YjbI with pentapeptide repeats